jgi:hypothetical protein
MSAAGARIVLGNVSQPSSLILAWFTREVKRTLQIQRNKLRNILETKFVRLVRKGEFGEFTKLWDALGKGHFVDEVVSKGDEPLKLLPWGSRLLAAVIRLCFTNADAHFPIEERCNSDHLHARVIQLSSICVSTQLIHACLHG